MLVYDVRAVVRMSEVPWRVNVMDCSSFSNSSVKVRLRCAATLGRDIFASNRGSIEVYKQCQTMNVDMDEMGCAS